MIDPLLDRLDAARRRLRLTQLLTGGVLVSAALLTALLGWFVCDYLFGTPLKDYDHFVTGFIDFIA